MLSLVNTDANLRVSKPLAHTLALLAARQQLGSDDSIPLDQLDYMAEAQSGLMVTMMVGQGVLSTTATPTAPSSSSATAL